MSECPKCGSKNIAGPQYRSYALAECLEFKCGRCGYKMSTDTKDAKIDPNTKEPEALK